MPGAHLDTYLRTPGEDLPWARKLLRDDGSADDAEMWAQAVSYAMSPDNRERIMDWRAPAFVPVLWPTQCESERQAEAWSLFLDAGEAAKKAREQLVIFGEEIVAKHGPDYNWSDKDEEYRMWALMGALHLMQRAVEVCIRICLDCGILARENVVRKGLVVVDPE